MLTRVRPVLAWQFDNPAANIGVKGMLNYIRDHYAEPNTLIYALASAPYNSA